MIISVNRIKKVLYYFKQGRINVFINAVKLTFFNNGFNLKKRNEKSKKDSDKTPLIFPIFKKITNSNSNNNNNNNNDLNPNYNLDTNPNTNTNTNFNPDPNLNYSPVTVSIIIPVYNQCDYTYMCLKSILENTKDNNIPYEIIIADDNSSDETVNIEKYAKNVKIIRNKNNLGFLKNCNNAAKYASGKYILFLNNDTEVQRNWLSNLLQLMESDKSIGLAGPKFIYPNGVLLEAGGIIWNDAESWHFGEYDNPNRAEYNYIKEADYISGACIMIKKELFENIGGFDEIYAPAYYEDSDLAFEVRKRGYKVVYQPESVVVHYENVSYKKSKKITDSDNFKKDAVKIAKKENCTINNNGNKDNKGNKEKFKQKWSRILETEHYGHMKNIVNARDRGNIYVYGDSYKNENSEDNKFANNKRINRILIDCSETYDGTLNTGIQRVVRNITERSDRMSKKLNVPVIPIVLGAKGYISLKTFLYSKNNKNNKNTENIVYHDINNPDNINNANNNINTKTYNKNRHKVKIKINLKEKIKIILIERLHINQNQNIYKILKAIWRLLKRLKYFSIGLMQIFNSYINSNNGHINGDIIFPEENDLLLLIDGFWSYSYNNYFNSFCKKIKKKKGIIIAVLYDIIALTNPEFFEKDLTSRFKKKMNKFDNLIDIVLTISKSEMEIIKEYFNNSLNNNTFHIKKKPTSFFYLGYDFKNKTCTALNNIQFTGDSIRENLFQLIDSVKQLNKIHKTDLTSLISRIYLTVGTIEPRKGYDYVFEAFEYLWKNGFGGVLVIVGKIGWNVDTLIKKFNNSAYLNKKLFIFNNLNDDELNFLYSSADAVICASLREGFGLPLVEAIHYGVPVLASDISVFREVGADYPVYFTPDEKGLIKAINEFEHKNNIKPNMKNIKNNCNNWDCSVDMLADRIAELIFNL
ncbi:MAG: glycosyltransferase [bacterium]